MVELAMQGDAAQVGVAGDTLNTAIYLQRSAPDFEVDYVTRLGACAFSERICGFIDEQGVGTSQVQMMPGQAPGLYAITTSAEGERSFSYWRDSSAARGLFAGNDFSVLEPYDTLYLSGISLAILPHSVREGLLEWLDRSSQRLVFDSNYRPALWDSVERARTITTAMWERADIALPSIDDEMALFEETADQVETRFSRFDGIGALKRGAGGPMSLGSFAMSGPVQSNLYLPAEEVVDTTAAGDSFNGGYLSVILSGASQAEALLRGHDLARHVVQHRGAIVRM
jgi:2-dehydro-3-deoxygluconokinase